MPCGLFESPTYLAFGKVTQVRLFFWVIKILATTVGETAADLLPVGLDRGLVTTFLVMSAAFAVGLVC